MTSVCDVIACRHRSIFPGNRRLITVAAAKPAIFLYPSAKLCNSSTLERTDGHPDFVARERKHEAADSSPGDEDGVPIMFCTHR